VIDEILKSFLVLFVIINPIGNLTIFIGLSHGMSIRKRIRVVNQALIIATILLFIFLFFGVRIFNFFSIGLDSFQIAGGIILLIMAVIYVLDIHTRNKHKGEQDLAAVPMSTPLLIGPGTITSTIILVSQYGLWITFIAAILALLCVWIIFSFSTKLYKFLGPHWSIVISRIMGLILAAIAVEFIKNGIMGL